jgi:hypothetical protein
MGSSERRCSGTELRSLASLFYGSMRDLPLSLFISIKEDREDYSPQMDAFSAPLIGV